MPKTGIKVNTLSPFIAGESEAERLCDLLKPGKEFTVDPDSWVWRKNEYHEPDRKDSWINRSLLIVFNGSLSIEFQWVLGQGPSSQYWNDYAN